MAMMPAPISVATLASATSANGTARTGAALIAGQIDKGSLVADCSVTIVTGSVVATVRWQGSADNSTWVDVKPPPNTAPTTTTATGTLAVECPQGAWGFPFIRATITLSGAATAAGDLTVVTYRYRPFWR